jgi:hypothetical protein
MSPKLTSTRAGLWKTRYVITDPTRRTPGPVGGEYVEAVQVAHQRQQSPADEVLGSR